MKCCWSFKSRNPEQTMAKTAGIAMMCALNTYILHKDSHVISCGYVWTPFLFTTRAQITILNFEGHKGQWVRTHVLSEATTCIIMLRCYGAARQSKRAQIPPMVLMKFESCKSGFKISADIWKFPQIYPSITRIVLTQLTDSSLS